jgi:signal transduction histidine kinase
MGLILLQGIMNLLLEALHRWNFELVSHSLTVERETEHLLSSTLDEQTTIRGYLLTGDKDFLKPYRLAQSDFHTSFYRLHALVQNPSQRQQLNQLRQLHDRWHDQFVLKVLAGTANPKILPGKTLFDPMRVIVKNILAQENLTLRRYKHQSSLLGIAKIGLDLFSLLAILIGVGWNLWLLRKRVEIPLRQLSVAGQAWREGKLDFRLDYASPDEIGRLAVLLDSMAREIRDRQQRSETHNQQLQDLISALSHDLRTPLIATRNTLRPMLNGAFGPVNPTWHEILTEFRQANEELLKLVEALLDVSRYDAGAGQNLTCEPLNWQRICDKAAHHIQTLSEHQRTLLIKLDCSLPIAHGDSLEIQRVIQNLLDNAVRVSQPHQPITLSVVASHPHQVRVEVQDHGPGITESDRERLFHRFMQGRGKRGGAGLGLYLCRQIVEAHGGTINVNSKVGQGSTFWFTLPVVTKSPTFNGKT